MSEIGERGGSTRTRGETTKTKNVRKCFAVTFFPLTRLGLEPGATYAEAGHASFNVLHSFQILPGPYPHIRSGKLTSRCL